MKSLALAGCAAALMLFSDAAMHSARASAQVFASGVMPALFPMMVISRLFVQPRSPDSMRSFVQTALFSFFSGSPASAQRVCALGVAERRLEVLLCLCGVMSPMFFTGTLTSWLHSRETGFELLLAHWLGAVLSALIWRVLPARDEQPAPAPAAQAVSLPEAIAQSARSMLAVCGAMMLFSTAAGVLSEMLMLLFPSWCRKHAALVAVGWAMLEIGGGAKAVIDAFPQLPGRCCARCARLEG